MKTLLIALTLALTCVAHGATKITVSESYQTELLKTLERYVRLASEKSCMESVRDNQMNLILVSSSAYGGFKKLHVFEAQDDRGRTTGTLEIHTDKGPKKFTMITSCRFNPAP